MSKDPVEKTLGVWVGNQVDSYKKKAYIMSNSEIRQEWERFTDEFKEYFMTGTEAWYDSLGKVKAFIQEKKKRPSKTSKDPVEKTLGRWICNQVECYKKKVKIMANPEIRQEWERFTL